MDIAAAIDRAAPCPVEGTAMVADVARLAAQELKPVRVFHVPLPVRLQMDLWRDAGIDMSSAPVGRGRSTLLGRIEDSPGGCAYLVMSDGICTVHAGIVLPEHRRKSMGRWLMIGAAQWAQDQGATQIALRCPDHARAFCDAIGMVAV